MSYISWTCLHVVRPGVRYNNGSEMCPDFCRHALSDQATELRCPYHSMMDDLWPKLVRENMLDMPEWRAYCKMAALNKRIYKKDGVYQILEVMLSSSKKGWDLISIQELMKVGAARDLLLSTF